MNKALIRSELARLLELPESAITDELQVNYDVAGWDSLTWISLVAFLISEMNCQVSIDQLITIQTIGDLWPLIKVDMK